MWLWIQAFVRDEGGQDIVEYALLTAAVGFAGAAAWPLVIEAIGGTYERIDTNQQDLWRPEDPS